MHGWISQKNTVDGKKIDTNKKEKNKFCCKVKLNWENVSVNSIGKEPFIGPNKCLVITLDHAKDLNMFTAPNLILMPPKILKKQWKSCLRRSIMFKIKVVDSTKIKKI